MSHPRLPGNEPNSCSATEPDFSAFEAFMRRARIEDCELVPWGSNYTFAVLLSDPAEDHPEALAIYKPVAGEIPLWDFPPETLYRREYAAYSLSQRLGWHFIPPTVIRDGPHGPGTMQQYIEAEEEDHYFAFRDDCRDELARIAAFDIIANNADRKAGHALRDAEDGRIWGIDHGLTFNIEPKLRTVIWDFQLEPVPGHIRADIRRVANDAELARELGKHLSPHEIRAFQMRATSFVRQGVYPPLTSRRSIPWGW